MFKPIEVQPNDDRFYHKIQLDTLARTIWGEGRSDGKEGMAAVASVILNRVDISQKRGGFWWGNNIIQVCQKPYQFSVWNRSDPNFTKVRDVNAKDTLFRDAILIADLAIAGELRDDTNGATHYHVKELQPYWSRNEIPIATIGNHIFYRIREY